MVEEMTNKWWYWADVITFYGMRILFIALIIMIVVKLFGG